MSLAAALILFLAGLAVGATSIGGILVVPVMTELAAVPIQAAIAASSCAFLFTGVAAVGLQAMTARTARSDAPLPIRLYLAALGGAAIGALTLAWLPSVMMRGVIAALALLSGLMTLYGTAPAAPADARAQPLPAAWTLAMGLAVGCASAWSGTGGPLVLLPILMLARAPTLASIEMAQGIQLPIAAAATTVNIVNGALNLQLGLLLGGLLLAGWGIGRKLSRRLPVAVLRRLVACGITTVGLWYGWQLF